MTIIKLIFIDTVWDIIYFPIWWYSKGFLLAFKWTVRAIVETENFVALRIWIKNILTPMYGQYDWQGRIVSFFMRVFQIIFRTIIFLAGTIFYVLLFIFYLILPIVIVYFLLIHAGII